MCELLGITSSAPADVVFSFTGLALRGGQTGPHADGWGLSLYDGHFARTFLEQDPAHSSELARFLRRNPLLTRLAVAHVRKKTRGVASLANTHPFVRVFGGRHLVFAHNGTLPAVKERRLSYESPIGDTDSEYAFCVLLEALREAYGNRLPDDGAELGKTLFELSNELTADGSMLNFILADGERLYARCGDNLHAIVWQAPHGQSTLVDAEVSVQLSDLLGSEPHASMAAVATSPLTRDESWVKAEPGMLWVFEAGRLAHAFEPPPNYEIGNVQAPPWEPS